MKVSVYYLVHHWWDGDKVSSPQWVHTGTHCALNSAKEEIEKMRRDGFKQFTLQKITKELLTF